MACSLQKIEASRELKVPNTIMYCKTRILGVLGHLSGDITWINGRHSHVVLLKFLRDTCNIRILLHYTLKDLKFFVNKGSKESAQHFFEYESCRTDDREYYHLLQISSAAAAQLLR